MAYLDFALYEVVFIAVDVVRVDVFVRDDGLIVILGVTWLNGWLAFVALGVRGIWFVLRTTAGVLGWGCIHDGELV